MQEFVLTKVTELHVKTVKYFRSIERVQDEVEEKHAALAARGKAEKDTNVGSME
jgi:glucosamine-6-phosphate deaminase